MEELKMTDKEMEDCLIDLYGTQFWFAIKKYCEMRANYAKQVLLITDPFKNPSEIAKTQGIINGLFDLQEYITRLEERKIEIEKDSK